MQDLAVQKEIGECGAGLGEFGMRVEFVGHAGEGVKLRGNLGVAQGLEQMLAVLGRDGYVGEAVEDYSGRVADFDMGEGAGFRDCGVVAPGGHQRSGNDPHIGLRIERDARGEI